MGLVIDCIIVIVVVAIVIISCSGSMKMCRKVGIVVFSWKEGKYYLFELLLKFVV